MRQLPQIKNFLRTPEERFQNLPDFPYTPHYTEVGGLRIAYIDEGPKDGPVVLLMHGEPAWSFLYRKMIPVLVQAGMRVLVPDQVGFGRTDKPTQRSDYTYENHVQWMSAWLESVDVQDITLFCQDWGSLIGLRMVAEMPDRFARIALSNGGLPTGNEKIPKAFHIWRAFAMYSPWFPIGKIVRAGCAQGLSDAAVAAYDAPYPSSRYAVGARVFPTLVPIHPSNPAREANERAWEMYKAWTKPFITLFSTRDPVTKGGEKMWQKKVPGAAGQKHTQIRGAAHFVQEDKGEEVAEALVSFISA
ncbi:haloalkane dehalogenase [Limnohabitans sp. MMS-10A-178]|jgi:haloalkane dehalogenase|uniref:haloalkane dehalogenase n=1 Tax=Limnohabitans sp. MMS-10A-178 TaxID=1835767 RepID=UPI000D3AD8E4|nr:haloalkane dehalogenase [Limnohabitans sp. MMS-10A-178]PUE17276.1 haloalkane dehalogenase [Limnohabitans sp. MMS-10A-178]